MGSYLLFALRGASVGSTSFLASGNAMFTQRIILDKYMRDYKTTLEELIYNISPTLVFRKDHINPQIFWDVQIVGIIVFVIWFQVF